MANEIKYQDQNWVEGTPIAGERLSTNGYYTGEHKGTPMQDALTDGTDVAHSNDYNTVHLGQVMQDALGNNPVAIEETE